MSKADKLKDLYTRASALNEDNPMELINKLSLYGQILELLGGFWAQAHTLWKDAEAKRKNTLAAIYSLDPQGTNKDKEMKAELAASEWRIKEAQFEGEALRWKNAYNSTDAQIQIMKKRYEHLSNVAKGGI